MARGAISQREALSIALLLVVGGLGIALATNNQSLLLVLLAYLALQVLYTIWIKHVIIADIVLLSLFYFLRLIGGAEATGVEPSPWILAITMLLALTVVSGKRLLEFPRLPDGNYTARPVINGYNKKMMKAAVISLGAIVVGAYLLWCYDNVSQDRFSFQESILSIPIILFGTYRYLSLVLAGKFDQDPARGLIRDTPLLLGVLAFIAYYLVLIYLG